MKWYLNEKIISLLQYYAVYFPVHSQLKELDHLALNLDPLPVADLFADRIDNETFWQKVINFFKGAKRVEMTQFDEHKELDKWELTELEDEMMRVLHEGLASKERKLLNLRSGKASSGDSQLFAMKLIEYILTETIQKARSERMRIEIYERLIHLINKMIVDFSHRYFNGGLIQILQLSIEKLDEMITYESRQQDLRSFQDSINEIHLGTFVRQLNEDLIKSIIPTSMNEGMYFEANRLNLASHSYDGYANSDLYRNTKKSVRNILKNENNYNLIRDGWLSNAANVKLFQSRADKSCLYNMSKQKVKSTAIEAALRERLNGKVEEMDLKDLVNRYQKLFQDLNRLYILSGLLSILKKRTAFLGHSSAILYQSEVSDWFKQALAVFEDLKDDLDELAISNRRLMPYLNHDHGRGILVTSTLSRTLEEVRVQILTAKRYMHVNREKVKYEHDEFMQLMKIGIDCVKDQLPNEGIKEGTKANKRQMSVRDNRYHIFGRKGVDEIEVPLELTVRHNGSRR